MGKENEMSSSPKSPIKVEASSQRIFSMDPDGPPRPEFTNAVEFSGMGMDVYMDVGVYSIESANNAASEVAKNPEGGQPTVEVYVAHRFGMSMQTAVLMHQRLTQFIQATQAALQAQAAQNAQNAPKASQE
jgi:hypothetical protein